MTETPIPTKAYEQKIVDDLDEEISIARGIEAAMRGLECLNNGMLEGVRQLQIVHIERLEAIRDRVEEEEKSLAA
jgi:hypothetical protein